ncbi:MAG: SlyX family protein [Gammaproteobacteria bacterium]|nr:SlyX family protein [Gammaproteobacteria bacterium]NND38315.1 SlyX family protein [Pseudomonadales bacterium]MBT8150893.1 SlyX family protein [Gammaproteobacteria bacterium]NNL11757.1 SlyX family protein [Pseudomonadales bacterium]NNM11457.1 SlyX family protein [Pseudomonadales bacterium]
MSMNSEHIELESKIAFLEKSVAELSDALYQQHQQIETLREQVDKFGDQFKSLNANSDIDPAFEKPPHY